MEPPRRTRRNPLADPDLRRRAGFASVIGAGVIAVGLLVAALLPR